MPPDSIPRQFLWNHAGRVAEYACLYASSVVIARGLGVEGNGLYAGLTSLMQGLLVASAMGADAALNKNIPQMTGEDAPARVRSILWPTIGVRLGLLLVVGGIGYALASTIPHPLAPPFREYGLILLSYATVRAATQLIGLALVASLRPAVSALVNGLIRVLELVLLMTLAQQGLSIGVILRLLVVTGSLQITCLVFFGRDVLVGGWSRARIGPVLTFGLIFWVNSIVDFFLGRFGDLFFLSLLLPEHSSASLYDVASSLSQAALLATTAGFAGVSFARLARLAATRPEEMNRFYDRLVRAISLLTIPLFAFLLFHGEQVIALFYSSSFAAAGHVLQILVFFRLCSRLFAGGENTEYLLSKGKVLPFVAIAVVAALVNIGLDLLLIPLLQAEGAAYASGMANLVVNALAWRLVRTSGGPRVQIRFWGRLVFICGFSSWLAGIAFGESLVFSVIAYLAAAISAAWLIKPLYSGDIQLLSNLHQSLAGIAAPFARPESEDYQRNQD